ncbi:PHP domain-containing protein [Virgibacillus profundi]|uniref:PHP domain-containing protein n=1 Tax=Virgibacillus profundi TaxID=2024555 RepID=UPI001F0A1CF0|nr:PHP domain-containing protein [Virgibacillus profundi]
MLQNKPKFINLHCHSDVSNIRLLDSTNSIQALLETAVKMNYQGLALTDHEALSNHLKAIKTARKMKENGTMSESFRIILGNELYLIDSLEEVRDNYQSGVTKFPHFLILSRSEVGHEQMRILSSRAWSRSFRTGLMERTVTLKSDIEEIVKPNQGHIIASSACLGSEINIRLLAIKEANENSDEQAAQLHRNKLNEFILWCIDVFGQDYFFIELQPALSEEQIYCNKELIKIADFYKLKRIITTDAHYPRPEDRAIHEAFLNAKEAEREVASFYEACFLANVDEIYERMSYIDTEILDDAISNTQLIGDMVEDYTLEKDTVIPKIDLPKFEVRHIFKPAYSKYEYIEKMANSDEEQNRYLVKLIEDGFEEKLKTPELTQEKFHQILARIDIELSELWEIGQEINQAMGSYYITVSEIIRIIWDDECGGDSLVAPGRGSSSGFILNYLLDITQINPLEYGIEMPHWRHLHKSRPDIGALDIDIDTEANKRPRIIQALKDHFGEDRILQVATFGTETSKAAITTACRGLGYDSDIALHLGSMIPFERGKNWSISDCLYGNEEKDRKPVKEFINEIERYPKLKETALGLNGLISKRGVHAGGVVLFPDIYYKTSSLMRAPNGTPITAYSLDDVQAMSNIKFD